MIYYLDSLDEDHSGPEATHVPWLIEHFGGMTCSQVNIDTCKGYVTARTTGAIGHKPVKQATAKRELETLSAALNRAWKAGKLDRLIAVWKPGTDEQEARWLTRDEAARLVRGALGFTPKGSDADGLVTGYTRVTRPDYHVARFILIALYTANPACGGAGAAVGAERALRVYRPKGAPNLSAGTEERETRKRRRPCPIPDRLLPHLRRWRRLTVIGPAEYAGEIIQRQKTGFEAARRLAKLGDEVTPHTLKHTCITWMLQKGVQTWEVAGFTSTSENLISRR